MMIFSLAYLQHQAMNMNNFILIIIFTLSFMLISFLSSMLIIIFYVDDNNLVLFTEACIQVCSLARSSLLCYKIALSLQFHLQLLPILWDVVGFMKLKIEQMGLVSITNLVQSLKDSTNNKEFAFLRPLVEFLNMQLFIWYSPLQFFLIGLSSNLMYKLPFCIVIYKKKCSCLNHRVMFILHISIMSASYINPSMVYVKLQELGFLNFQTSLSPQISMNRDDTSLFVFHTLTIIVVYIFIYVN